MAVAKTTKEYTYQERMDALRAAKIAATQEKQEIIGAMDYDDWAMILPPEDRREMTKAMSGSGVEVTEVKLNGIDMRFPDPSGGFFGPRDTGYNYRQLLEAHPVYIDPLSSLAGAYMVNFYSYIKVGWKPELDYSHLKPNHALYNISPGIGAKQHFCQDLQIGLDLGFGGLMDKIEKYRAINGEEKAAYYDGLTHVVKGMQNWVSRSAAACREMALEEENPQLKQNLIEMAEMNEYLVEGAPRTFREACQWMVWYQMTARMYNGSGSKGRLDVLLTPYYEREVAAGTLTEDEAVFHVACLLLRDTAYLQVGGPDGTGKDVTNDMSYIVLEASRRLNIPVNVGVAVGASTDPNLARKGVEIQFENKNGVPKFLGVDSTAHDFTKNGYDLSLGYERAYSGCHWSGIPGREYTLMDTIKVNLAKVFEVAWEDMMSQEGVEPSLDLLWETYEKHVKIATDTIKEGIDFHLEHMHEVTPELVLSLLCHGPIEKGLDASHGGVEFYNMCTDAVALATVADSFAAIEQRIVNEGRISWDELKQHIDSDWAGDDGERARLMMKNIHRYGYGGSLGDKWAEKVSKGFAESVASTPTPEGRNVIPGIFSWALTIKYGEAVGATPNGRHARGAISHGASPDPGFRQDGAPSAMATAVAAVQPAYGNTAPLQLDFEPRLGGEEGGIENVTDLVKTHFALGGTQINMNVMDQQKVLAAHEDPTKYPDLVVRVTGFSAYFASLSKEFRQLVVDRIIAEGQ